MSSTGRDTGERDGDRHVDEALAAYYRLVDSGQDVNVDQFVRDYPDHVEQLRHLLQTVQLIEKMAGPVEAAPGNGAANREIEPANGASAREGDAAFDSGATVAFHPRQSHGQSSPLYDALNDRRFGEYVELSPIGQGGMGVVYRAHQSSLNRVVALKMIRAGVLASDPDVRRFQVEARAAAKLNHPNIVKVYEVGELEGQHYFTMELVEGTDLAKLISSEIELSSRQIARVIMKAAEAIQHAHECQVVHRDLKPANILIDQRGRPLITDFGLAKDASEDRGLTADGSSLGTPSYMSPEQAAGRLEDVGPASDIYSLGAILYELLAGRPPFKADTTVDTILDAIHKTPVAPRALNPAADRLLEAICLKCLHKDPRQRYSTAKALADDLSRYLEGKTVAARPPNLLQKSWHWLRDVPLVAAIVGKRVTHPSLAHRIVQWVAVAGVCVLFALPFLWGTEQPYPAPIRFAAGRPGGEYFEFVNDLRDVLTRKGLDAEAPIPTAGAIENRSLLLDDQADVGLLQASALLGFSEDLAVVAPLFQEFVLIIVPGDSSIENVSDLQDKDVLVGDAKSGMRQSARQLLDLLSISARTLDRNYGELESKAFDAAVVTSGARNPSLARFLAAGDYRLLPLTQDEIIQVSGLEVFTTRALPANAISPGLPPQNMQCITTKTYLVLRKNASSRFALDLLKGVRDLTRDYELASIDEPDNWGLAPVHPAVALYLDR